MLSVKMAAARAGVSPALVYVWIESGMLAHYRLGSKGSRGRIRIAEADLDVFLASMRCEGKQGEGRQVKRPANPGRPFKLQHIRIS